MQSMPRTLMTQAILCPNPSMMTLKGTNTYLISAPGSETVTIVDPGPDGYPDHLDALQEVADGRPVELILLTHHHGDHSGAVKELHERTGAPVRAFKPELCRNAEPLADDERILSSEAIINVLHTPGHTSDSVCFYLAGDDENGSVITGDTILGQGTTMLDYPDGTLMDYFASLERLRSVESEGPITVLPAHGPALPDLAVAAEAYLDHRKERLSQFKKYLADHQFDLEQAREKDSDIAVSLYGSGTADADTMGMRITVQMVHAMIDYLQEKGQS